MARLVWLMAASWLAFLLSWWLVSRLVRSTETKRIRSRLLAETGGREGSKKKNAPGLLVKEDQHTGRLILRLITRFALKERLQAFLEQAGLRWHVARLLHASLALYLAAFAAIWYGLPHLRPLALVLAAGPAMLPLAYVWRRRRNRLRRFEEQFPEGLEFVSRSMRAGHAFSVALEMLHKEFPDPLGGEFRRAFDEHNLGLPLDVALQKLAARVPLMDVQFFVSAVLLQKRTGGNLAEVLDKLAYVIRERFKLRGRIRAISAHGRMTGLALSLIPAGVAAVMFIGNRDYVRFFFTDPTGQWMLGGALVLQLIGYAAMRKIVAIEI